jgi:hypothetical protein
MIRVLSITVYKADTSDKLYYESFRDKQFRSNDDIRDWTHYIERQWEDVKGYKCSAYPIRRSKPQKEIDMMSVLTHTAHIMGQPFDEVISGSRKREFVDVRKVACGILLDADYPPMEIEKQLPFRNRIIYSYREKLEDMIATEKGFEDRYNDIKSKVMSLVCSNGKES